MALARNYPMCENAKALNRNRRSYSSKTVSGIQFENTFDLEIETEECHSRRVSIFCVFTQPGSFATEPADLARQLMSASLRNRPICCVAVK
jgi:hypothetical protein